MGVPELATDCRYDTNERRVQRRGEVLALINGWLARFADHNEVLEILGRFDVASALVLTVPEAIAHPHNRSRRAVRTVDDELWGQITIPGVPIRMASVGEELRLAARELGADNAGVLSEVLGLNADEIDEMTADEVLCAAPYHES
jgi:crotonobetainyl-CoA:carnitine CoA-transferase CaiB-like acyl-CoA transferase